MSDLRNRLDDLLGAPAAHVAAPDPAAAWRAGGRRRARRRAAAGAATLVLVVLLGLGAGLLPRSGTVQPAERDGGVGGYPTRIDDPWRLRDLPDAPGPVAGILDLGPEERIVGPDGRTWRLPDRGDLVDSFPAALSRDGRMLGYLASGGEYVVHDLATGERRSIAGVTDNLPHGRGASWWVAPQAPSFWSPDGSAVLVRATRWDDSGDVGALLLGADGSVREVLDHLFPIGWLAPDRLAWLDERERRTMLVVTDLGGEIVRESAVPRIPMLDQWTGSVSPDGSLVVLGDTERGRLLYLSTQTGEVVRRDRAEPDDGCVPSWRGDEVTRLVRSDAGAELLSPAGGTRVRSLVRVDPDLDVYCLTLAGDALAGEAYEPADRRGQEVALVLATIALLGGCRLLRRRARARLSG